MPYRKQAIRLTVLGLNHLFHTLWYATPYKKQDIRLAVLEPNHLFHTLWYRISSLGIAVVSVQIRNFLKMAIRSPERPFYISLTQRLDELPR